MVAGAQTRLLCAHKHTEGESDSALIPRLFFLNHFVLVLCEVSALTLSHRLIFPIVNTTIRCSQPEVCGRDVDCHIKVGSSRALLKPNYGKRLFPSSSYKASSEYSPLLFKARLGCD